MMRFPQPLHGVRVDAQVREHTALAHNVAEEEDVDSVLREAAGAGATIVKEAQEIFFGRHGFFADPDGYLWRPYRDLGMRPATD